MGTKCVDVSFPLRTEFVMEPSLRLGMTRLATPSRPLTEAEADEERRDPAHP